MSKVALLAFVLVLVGCEFKDDALNFCAQCLRTCAPVGVRECQYGVVYKPETQPRCVCK